MFLFIVFVLELLTYVLKTRELNFVHFLKPVHSTIIVLSIFLLLVVTVQ